MEDPNDWDISEEEEESLQEEEEEEELVEEEEEPVEEEEEEEEEPVEEEEEEEEEEVEEEEDLDEEDQESEVEEEEGELEVQERREYKNAKSMYCDVQPTKRPKNLVDRISELPDSVICHILSLMPTRYAVRTSALSKRWLHTWASTFALIYDYDHGSLQEFNKFVDRTLILHKSSTIQKFVLNSHRNCSSVNLWIHAAVIKQVEELSINLPSAYILLPHSLYSCDSLIRLSLTCTSISSPYSPVHWRSLKHLTLTCTKLEDDVIQKFLDGSPLLESLELIRCGIFSDINLKSVRRLVISGYSGYYMHHDWLEIDSSNLQSLEIQGYMGDHKCRLKNVQSLVYVNLTFSMRRCDENHQRLQDLQNMVRNLMEKVRRVRNLTVGHWILQALSTHELKHIPSSISMCKCLVLEETDQYCNNFPGIARLLQTSPILERLVIHTSISPYKVQRLYLRELWKFNGSNYWASKDVVSQYLKIVEFIGFSELTTEYAEFLLKNSKALEKMIITKKKGSGSRLHFRESDLIPVITKLLSFPRSSPKAQIILS